MPTHYNQQFVNSPREVAQGLILDAETHNKLLGHIFNLMHRGERGREERASYFARIERDLYGEVAPSGSDCARDLARANGEGAGIPDQLFPIGLAKLHELAAEITSIVMPVEAPYSVASSDISDQDLLDNLAKALRYQGQQFHHRSHVTTAVRDAITLNFAGIQFDWETKSTGQRNEDNKTVSISGAAVRHMDPYNIGYDTNLSLTDAVTTGDCVYFIERESGEQLLRKSANADNANRLFVKVEDLNIVNQFRGSTQFAYIEPSIRKSMFNYDQNEKNTGFSAIFGRGGGQTPLFGAGGSFNNRYQLHEITRAYVRLVPSDWGLITNKADKSYKLYEFVILNGNMIVRLNPIGDEDTPAPLALGSFDFDRPLNRSSALGEQAADMSTYMSAMLNLHKRSVRASVGGGLVFYDPTRFDLSDPDVQHGRIPLKQQAYNDPELGKYVKQLSSTIDSRNTLGNIDALTEMLGSLIPEGARPDLAGLDRATTFHAMAVAATAPIAVLHYATIIDDQMFAPKRHAIRNLNLIHGEGLEYIDEKTQQVLTIAQQELKTMNFRMTAAAVLSGVDKLRISMLMRDALNITAQMGDQIPAAAMPLLEHWLKLEGSGFDVPAYKEAVSALMQENEERLIRQQEAAAQAGAPAGPSTQEG